MNKDSDSNSDSSKVTKRSLFRRSAKKMPPTRITNDNVELHREIILSRGRKLKYPIQYSKIRLLTITLAVVLVAIISFAVWLHRSLYVRQQTSSFYYSATKILPLSVASVDNVAVPYQDYLRRIRADIHYYINREGRSFNSNEGKRELDYHKRKNLLVAERVALVHHLAKAEGVSVSNSEVEKKIKAMRESDGASEEDLINTLNTYYGWTMSDFRTTIYDQLLEQKLSYKIDKKASQRINDIKHQLSTGKDFANLAKEQSDDKAAKESGGVNVAKVGSSDPSGIVDKVSKLQVGQTTNIERAQVNGNDYYYIAKLNRRSDDQLEYSIILVELNVIDKKMTDLRKGNKIKEYISVPPESDFASPSSKQ